MGSYRHSEVKVESSSLVHTVVVTLYQEQVTLIQLFQLYVTFYSFSISQLQVKKMHVEGVFPVLQCKLFKLDPQRYSWVKS